MSALFGKVCQNGYVVRDIDAALKFWTEVLRVVIEISDVSGSEGRFFERIKAAAAEWHGSESRACRGLKSRQPDATLHASAS